MTADGDRGVNSSIFRMQTIWPSIDATGARNFTEAMPPAQAVQFGDSSLNLITQPFEA